MVLAGAFWMNRSPGLACSKAKQTKSTASSRFMRKRVMAGSVTVSGCPLRMRSMNSGITLPRLHITLPYRVQQIVVRPAAVRALA